MVFEQGYINLNDKSVYWNGKSVYEMANQFIKRESVGLTNFDFDGILCYNQLIFFSFLHLAIPAILKLSKY